MTDIPGMILWTDAYLADTVHLTTFEHGAYDLILMAMWRSGGKLANDSKLLALLAKTTPEKWRRIEKKIMSFMTIEGDFITQKRLKLEYQLAQSRNTKRVEAGRLGGIARALKNKEPTPSNASGNAAASLDNFNFKIKKDKDSFYQNAPREARAASPARGSRSAALPKGGERKRIAEEEELAKLKQKYRTRQTAVSPELRAKLEDWNKA